jgi:hypothetical protein
MRGGACPTKQAFEIDVQRCLTNNMQSGIRITPHLLDQCVVEENKKRNSGCTYSSNSVKSLLQTPSPNNIRRAERIAKIKAGLGKF